MTDTYASTARSIVFVDSRVQDAAALLQGLDPGTEVIHLDARQDGLAQMAAALGTRGDVGAVQVIAHGSAGQLWLGSSFLDNTALQLPGVQAQLAALGQGLTADGDLLIYACNTAEGSEGVQFVNTLAALTGADVAASSNRTGAGGDWVLEVITGDIAPAAMAAPLNAADWQHGLATITVTSGADAGAGSLRQAIDDAVAGDTITFAAGLAFTTITLTSGQLEIAQNLTIDGDLDDDGTADIGISGNDTSRVLNITAGMVLLDGLDIINGKVVGSAGTAALGAGLSVTGSGTVVTILHSSIQDNQAAGGGGSGSYFIGGNGGNAVGGIYIGANAMVKMAHSSVQYNHGNGGNGSNGYDFGGNGGNGTGGVLVAGTGTFRYDGGTTTIADNEGFGGVGGIATTIWLGSPGAPGASAANISGSGSIDNTWTYTPPAPTVTSVAATTADGAYTVGAIITLTVTFSEAVFVTGTPQLTLETGATDRTADYQGGDGSDTLSFTYTVLAGDTAADLDYASTTALSTNGGTIQNAASTNAVLTLPAPASANSLAGSSDIVIDTTAPGAVTLNVSFSADTGSDHTDLITKTAAQTITGTLSSILLPGETVEVSLNNGSTWNTAPAVGSTWQISTTLTATDTLQARVKDAAGNLGTASSYAYVLDTTAPAAPVLLLDPASDKGLSSTDGITYINTPTFTGTAEAQSTVEVFDGSTSLGTTTADGAGHWSLTAGSILAEGTHNSITAIATDVAGNASGNSTALEITIDNTGPTLTIATDKTTLNASQTATITFTFTEDPGTSFAWDGSAGDVMVAGGTLGAITGTGLERTATFTPTAGVANGLATISVDGGTYTDVAGNLGGAGAVPTLTIDTVAPTATVTGVTFSDDTGSKADDLVTHTAAQTISIDFSAPLAGDTLEISLDNGASWLTAFTGKGGTSPATVSTTLTASNTLLAQVKDAAGNIGPQYSHAYVLDTTAPAPLPLTSTPADNATGVAVGSNITIAFTEALDPLGSNTSLVYLKDVLTDTPVAAIISIDGSGKLLIDPSANLAQGTAYYVTWDAGALADLAGNTAVAVSDETTYNFTAQAAPPPPPPPPPPAPPTVDGVPVTTTPGDGGTTITTIPVVLPTRPDDPGTPHPTLADIPLITGSDGHPIVQVGLPAGVGVTAQGLPQAISGEAALAELGLRIERVAGNGSELTHNGEVFFASMGPDEKLTVHTITATTGAGFDPNVPLVISGSALPADGMQAIILDARALPSGTLVQVDNVDFLAIVGAVRVIGGAGQNAASGDGASQWIVLGADDDVLHGGGGNDVVASKGGNDRLFGDDGDDFIVGGSGDDHLEGGAGNDVLQGGASDAGAWSFALNADRTLQMHYSARQELLTDVHTLTAAVAAAGGQVLDERIALVWQDYGQLEIISLLYQGLTRALPTLQDMNLLSTQGWSRAETLQAAWGWFESTLPASASTQDKVHALLAQTWGSQAATAENVQIGLDYLAQGGTWSGALEFLVDQPGMRDAITHDGALQLTQTAPLGEWGWSADSGNDTLLGGAGNDVLIGGGGNDILDGGEGTDLAVFFGVLEQFSLERRSVQGHDELVLRHMLSGEEDVLRNVELLQFGEQVYRLDLAGLQQGQAPQALAGHVQALSSTELVLLGLPAF